jgi:hypothetical protein
MDVEPAPSNASPVWVLIVGVSFLGLAVIFIMVLILLGVAGFPLPDNVNSKFLICALLALVTSIGSGFLGGSAAASGTIPLPRILQNPISFGITGGIAVFIIVLLLSSWIYIFRDTSPSVETPKIINVVSEENEDLNDITVTYQPVPLPPKYTLQIEIAKDKEFKQLASKRYKIDTPSNGEASMALKQPENIDYWIRLVVMTPDDKIVIGSEPKSFKPELN